MNNTESDLARMGQCLTLGLIVDKIRSINSNKIDQKILPELHHYIYLHALLNKVILDNNFSQSSLPRSDLVDLEIVGKAMLQARLIETDGGSIVAGDMNRALEVILDVIKKIVKTGELDHKSVDDLDPFLLAISEVSNQMHREMIAKQPVQPLVHEDFWV